MISPFNQTYTSQEEMEAHLFIVKFIGFIFGIALTILASFYWTGLALMGMGFLSLSFGLITISLLHQRHSGMAHWGTVILGQCLGCGGIAILLIDYLS